VTRLVKSSLRSTRCFLSETRFDFPFPALPPGEEWFVKDASVSVTALDADGNVLAGASVGRVAEGCMLQATPVPTARPALPATGSGRDPSSEPMIVLALALGAIAVLLGSTILIRRRP
jgi:hypothetical protein